MSKSEPEKSTEFLIADLNHFGESLWRNEEIGEKRFEFFLTLVTAVIAGLVVLYTKKNNINIDDESLKTIMNGTISMLLVFGLMTYLRMLQRNRITDDYKHTLKYIRKKLLDLNPSFTEYSVPHHNDIGIWKWFRGGFAETVGAMCAFLVLGLLILNSVTLCLAIIVGMLVLITTWVLAITRK